MVFVVFDWNRLFNPTCKVLQIPQNATCDWPGAKNAMGDGVKISPAVDNASRVSDVD
jgi:hypothetical protein